MVYSLFFIDCRVASLLAMTAAELDCRVASLLAMTAAELDCRVASLLAMTALVVGLPRRFASH